MSIIDKDFNEYDKYFENIEHSNQNYNHLKISEHAFHVVMKELRAGAEKEGQGKTKNHLRYFGNIWNILEKESCADLEIQGCWR